MYKFARITALAIVLCLGVLAAAGCSGGGDDDNTVTVYAGRSQTLVGPLLDQFFKDTGIHIKVRYGDGTDLALAILEEGKNSPADVYYGQDVGALGALKAAGRLQAVSDSVLEQVPPAYRSPEGLWVGISGRARVMVYNTDRIDPTTLPESALDYVQPQWKGRVGVVPRSDGFPEFITAVRLVKGQDFAERWLNQLRSNDAKTFANNLAALQAVAAGEIDVAFLNHYYLYRFLSEQGPSFKARNYFFDNGDLGGIFLVAGAAVLDTAKNKPAAEKFIEYLLSPAAQKYFANSTHEYPLVAGVTGDPLLPPLASLKGPEVDLSDLTDLLGSLDLMRKTGILP